MDKTYNRLATVVLVGNDVYGSAMRCDRPHEALRFVGYFLNTIIWHI